MQVRSLWPFGVMALAAILVLLTQRQLLGYFYFGDEGETIVAAQMMAAGDRLYTGIFNHHGPLTFYLPMAVEALTNGGLRASRVAIAVLQWLALAAVYFSPMLRDGVARMVCALLAATVMVGYLPEAMGHTMQYHVLAGLMTLVALCQYVVPSIARVPLAPWRIALGSALLASLPFLAVTYLPLSVLLFASSLRTGTKRLALVGAGSAIAVNLVGLAATGSMAGYLVEHFYINSKLLRPFSGQPSVAAMVPMIARALSASLLPFAVLCGAVAIGGVLARYEGTRLPWRTLLTGAALCSVLLRGVGPHELYTLPLAYGALALPVVLFGLTGARHARGLLVVAIALICLVRLADVGLTDRKRYAAKPLPLRTEFGDLAQAMTAPGERILAYSFAPHEYLAAKRLPASAQFFYLPWQAEYERQPPVLGVALNACADILRNKPKLILLDRWLVFDRYPWESYAGCVQEIVDRDYVRVEGKPYYVLRGAQTR